MPDLDDLFEDLFDGVKKQVRKNKKKRKQRKKWEAKQARTQHTPAHRPVSRPEPKTLPKEIYRESPQPRPNFFERLFGGGTLGNEPQIHDARLQGYLAQARAYHAGVRELARKAPNDFNRGRLDDLVRHADHWQNSLRALVGRIDSFQQNTVLQHDLATVPEAIFRLEAQLAAGPPPRLEQELNRTLANRRRQLEALENLRSTMDWAEIKVETTVSMLGAIYSQALMSQSKGQVADYRRLLADVEEEARSLDDYVAALAAVKLGTAGNADWSGGPQTAYSPL
jgi:hypothetical protein